MSCIYKLNFIISFCGICVCDVFVPVTNKMTINRLRQISNCLALDLQPTCLQNTAVSLAFLWWRTLYRPIKIRPTPGYFQAELKRIVCYLFKIKWRNRVLSLFAHRWAWNHFLSILFVQISPPVGEILCWALLHYWSQSRWLTADMQGSLANAGTVLQCYWQHGKRADLV